MINFKKQLNIPTAIQHRLKSSLKSTQLSMARTLLAVSTLAIPALATPLLANTVDEHNSLPHMTPATFNFEGSAIESQIQPQHLPQPPLNVAVYCQSTISTTGKNLSTTCFDKHKTTHLEAQIVSALSKLTFVPASIAGKTVAVRMNYRVIYQHEKDAAHSVLLIPNLGSLQAELGVNYSEPQELVSKGWFESFNATNELSGSFFKHNHTITRASASITRQGKAKHINIIDTANRERLSTFTNALEHAQFIPGYIDGKAAPMKYLAIAASNN